MVAIELASPGRTRISRKTIAQGRPGVLRWTCMLVCAFCCARCTRDRGCSAHPVFPAPSVFEGGKRTANLGRIAPRDRGRTFKWEQRHCEEPLRRSNPFFLYARDGLLRCARNDGGDGAFARCVGTQ